jgi:CheY-like chemotaxis protein
MARILIADDEAILSMYLEEILTQFGHDVIGAASSGWEAVDLAGVLLPDIIIMDISMPGDIDGIEAAGIIKTSLGIPAIFMTAYSEVPIIDRAREVDPYGYLIKPVQNIGAKIVVESALSRLHAERKLVENEQRFRDIVYSMADWIWELDENGKYTYAAGKVTDILAGNIKGYRGINKDITRSKRFSDSLKKVQDNFNVSMDYLNIGLSLISRDMEIIDINQTMSNWFSVKNISTKPRCYEVFRIGHQSKPCEDCNVVHTLEDRSVHEAISEMETSSGKLTVRRVSFPVIDMENRIIAAIQITEKKSQHEHQCRIS